MHLVQNYPYVAIDTEFLGLFGEPADTNIPPSTYQCSVACKMRILVKLIQLEVNFFDENGKPAHDRGTWQFNLKSNVEEDTIRFLTESSIKLDKPEQDGIDPNKFTELCTTCDTVLSDSVKRIPIHGAYDFGYLLKVLTGKHLLKKLFERFGLLGIYFPPPTTSRAS